MSAYTALPRKLRRFVDAYVRLGVGTKAARLVVPESLRPDVMASKWLARANVREAVEEREKEAIAEAGLTTADIYREIKRIVNFDPLPHLIDENDKPVRIRDIPEDVRRAMRSYELVLGKDGKLAVVGKIRSFDKLRALELNSKLKRLYTETVEHKGVVTLEQLVKASFPEEPTKGPPAARDDDDDADDDDDNGS